MEAGSPNNEGRPFQSPEKSIGPLDGSAVAGLIAATADIALVLDSHGVIRDLSLGNAGLSENVSPDRWIGRPWIDTVTVESREKIEALLNGAQNATGGGRWRQVNHPLNNGSDLPVRYLLFKLGNHLVAYGQDQRALASLQQRLVEAQQSVEREYSRLRLAETRYRLLFQVTSEPVLIVDANSMKVRECNPAAADALGDDVKRINGRSVLTRIDAATRTAVERYLERVRVDGRGADISCTLEGGGDVTLSASLFRQDNTAYFLVRFVGANQIVASPNRAERFNLGALIENLPDAFVVTDSANNVLTANTAFLDLAQLASPEQLRDRGIDRWLGRTEVDFRVLQNTLQERGTVRRYATALRGELGATEEVEVSVVVAQNKDQPCFAYLFRRIAVGGYEPSPRPGSANDSDLHRSVEKLAELVGRVPMKDIVRETTDMIERMCIEAALDLTGDNRASAADVLGLSRQSLYVKLRRFGLRDYDGN